MLLGKKLSIFKTRVDAAGNKVPDKDSMPDNGVENEYFPLQTFVRDFVNGQTYALEIAWARGIDDTGSLVIFMFSTNFAAAPATRNSASRSAIMISISLRNICTAG